MKAIEIMTPFPTCVDYSNGIKEAYRTMRSMKIRHLPVIAKRTVIGMLSEKNITDCFARANELSKIETTTVESIMDHGTIACGPMTPIETIVRLMIGRKIEALPVVTMRGSIIGIITKSDLLKTFDLDDESSLNQILLQATH